MRKLLIVSIFLINTVYAQSLDKCFDVFIPNKLTTNSVRVKAVTKNAYKYLNKSVDNWFENTNVRNSQKCLSCHTTLPYMMLGAADNLLTKKNYIRELVQKRTDNFKRDGFVEADNLPWYELNKSYSTEVVLNASSVVMAEKLVARNAGLSDLAKDAYNLMWKRQKQDGSFEWLDHFGLRPHESQNSGYWGTSMAGVMGGLVESQASSKLKKTYKYLAEEFESQSNHNKLFGLWANAEARGDSFLSIAKVNKLLKEIKSKQNADGGWSSDFILGTGETQTDAYATSIVAFVLKNSDQAVPNERAVRKLLVEKLEKSGETIGTRSMNGAAVSPSPNGISGSDFFSDMATSYGLMYLNK